MRSSKERDNRNAANRWSSTSTFQKRVFGAEREITERNKRETKSCIMRRRDCRGMIGADGRRCDEKQEIKGENMEENEETCCFSLSLPNRKTRRGSLL